MLFGEVEPLGVADEHGGHSELWRDGLEAGVDDRLVRRRPADHRHQDGEGVLVVRSADGGVLRVHRGVGAALELGHPGQAAGDRVRAGAAAADLAHPEAAGLDLLAGEECLAHVELGACLALCERHHVLQVALVGLKAVERKPVGLVDEPGQLRRRLARLHAAAVHADVDLNVAAERDAGGDRRLRELPHVPGVVDGDRDLAAPRQLDQARDLERPDDLVGDQDVRDTAVGQRLCFTDLGTGDAHGAGVELQVRDLDALVRLGVRAELRRPARRELRHALDVALQLGLVEQERGGVYLCVHGLVVRHGDSS